MIIGFLKNSPKAEIHPRKLIKFCRIFLTRIIHTFILRGMFVPDNRESYFLLYHSKAQIEAVGIEVEGLFIPAFVV